MKKVNFTYRNQNYNGFIVIENMSDLIDYFHERLCGMQKETARELVDRAMVNDGTITESSTPIIKIIQVESKIKGGGFY